MSYLYTSYPCTIILHTIIYITVRLQIRANLELDLSRPTSISLDDSEYTTSDALNLFLKEVFRRYPSSGNMTVRTVDREDYKLGQGHAVPIGTPIHVHIWTLQNSSREWYKPRDFLPERWATDTSNKKSTDNNNTSDESKTEALEGQPVLGYPQCPFLSNLSKHKQTSTTRPLDPAYEGVGFTEGSLSFFPFLTGARACPAKYFAVTAITRVLTYVIPRYRIDPAASFWEEDPGQSQSAIIVSYIV